MIKVLSLVFSVGVALTLVAGYVYLDSRITAGEGIVSDGQRQLDQAQPQLDSGKAKLEAGKRELAAGKVKYENAHDNLFMVVVDQVFNGGRAFEDGRSKIAAGDKQVAQGEVNISDGEKLLAAGELELYRGREQLLLAQGARVACAIGAVLLGVLSILLAFLWRRSLAQLFKKKKQAWFGRR